MKAEEQEELRAARQAAMWLIRLRSEGRECHAPFTAWLLESSRHVKAYLMASAMTSRLRESESLRNVDIAALISQANDRVVPLTWRSTEEPVPFGATDRAEVRRPYLNPGRSWRAAVAVLAAAGMVFLFRIQSSRGAETYTTAVGEQFQVKLQDGSLVLLNTDSRVRVQYTRGARDIELLKGEALFTVEHDPRRPFRVSTGTAIVDALGTQFGVYRQAMQTVVEVVEGDVNVSKDPTITSQVTAQRTHLRKGDLASIDPTGQIHNAARNVQLSQNWQKRLLVFSNGSVAEAAEQFNRYNRTQIIIEDDDLGKLGVDGTFKADHPQGLFRFLQMTDPRVTVETKEDKYILRFKSQDRR